MKKNDIQSINENDLSGKRDMEANLLAIIENTDDLIYSLDRDFRYITLNGALKRKIKTLFGIDAKVGDKTFDFLLDIDIKESKYWKDIYALGLKGEPINFVKEFGYSGVQEFWNFSVNPIRQNGEITGLSCFGRDVTELRKTRIEVEMSEKKYRLMFNSNPMPSWIYDADTLKFIDVNDAAIGHYGYSRDEFLSMTIQDIRPEHDLLGLMEIINAKRHLVKEYRTDRQHRKANGEIIDIRALTCPIDMDGKTNVLVLAEDVTEKKKAAADLRESEERYRLVAENPLLGVAWCSLTGNLLYLNETFCNMVGYTAAELVKMTCAMITHPEDHAREVLMLRAMAKGEIDHYKFEKRYIRKDGQHIWVELNLTRVKNATGQEYCIGIVQDISQRKEIEDTIQRLNEGLEEQIQRRTEQLKDAYAELESFTYSVSHDLRSPLRVINGFARILIQDMADRMRPEEKEYMEIIGEKVVRMDALIKDMLKLSTVDKTDLVKDNVDMHAMVVNVLEELNYALGGYNADINILTLPMAFGDSSMIKQVWVNLISNAIKYSTKKHDARIEIGSTNINDEIVYYVRDNGAGFDMKNAHKLFNAFQRLHHDSDFEGTGVGLALVNRIITKHGGRIWADAKVDVGATFYFSLS
jgi:PAS domain S-box-containing protein